MQRSFKIGIFLAALGMAALITAQPSPAQAEMVAASAQPSDNADTTARLNAELKEKRARAAKNREAMQKKIDEGNDKFSDMADMDEDDQKEVDSRVKKMLGEHPDAIPAQPVAADDQDTDGKKKHAQNKKPRRVVKPKPDSYVYEKPSRAAPAYEHR